MYFISDIFTIGGLLVCLPADKAEAFCDAVHTADNTVWGRPWIIGRVVPGMWDRKRKGTWEYDDAVIVVVYNGNLIDFIYSLCSTVYQVTVCLIINNTD